MTTVNITYLLMRSPPQPVYVRLWAAPNGRNISQAQDTAEQTAAVIEREVGRLLQLALAAAQLPGVTPASGSVYAPVVAAGGVSLAEIEASTVLAKESTVAGVVARLPSGAAKIAGEGVTAKNLDQVAVDISTLATSTEITNLPAAMRSNLLVELASIETTRTLVSGL
jgi:hypothetical protein